MHIHAIEATNLSRDTQRNYRSQVLLADALRGTGEHKRAIVRSCAYMLTGFLL